MTEHLLGQSDFLAGIAVTVTKSAVGGPDANSVGGDQHVIETHVRHQLYNALGCVQDEVPIKRGRGIR